MALDNRLEPVRSIVKDVTDMLGVKMIRMLRTLFFVTILVGCYSVGSDCIYAQEVGTLHVVITPQSAIDAGAQWRVGGGAWRESGGYVALEVGDHTVEFKEIERWATPQNQIVDISVGHVTQVTGVYSGSEPGSLRVILTPEAAIQAGAQWNVDGGEWQDSGATVSGLDVSEHTIYYKNVSGWVAPVNEIIPLSENETKNITRSYVQQPVTVFCVTDAAEFQTALTAAASNGQSDIIRMVQGTYSGNFTYASYEANSLTLEGGYREGCASREIDPENTVLDGGGTDTVLALVSQESANFSVEGLTLQNGNALTVAYGGGLYVRTEGYITLKNNRVRDNTASGYGGGVYIDVKTSGQVTIENSTFSDNMASAKGGGVYVTVVSAGDRVSLKNSRLEGNISANGGGVYLEGSGTLTKNSFNRNTASVSGGGVYVYCSGSTVSSNTFSENTAESVGGGAIVGGGTVTNNAFIDNRASGYAGGLYVYGNSTVSDNTFRGNTASLYSGGGAYIKSGGTIENNLIIQNISGENGGGIYSVSNPITLTNNTIIGNSAENQGGGIWVTLIRVDYEGKVYNNIIWNNSASVGGDLYINNRGDDPFLPAPVALFNNDFDQSASGICIEIPFAIDPSNLDNEDPLFLGGNNYHLSPPSPCINTGDSNAPDLPGTDMDGNPRISGGTVDMGAYEYNPSAPTADAGADQTVVAGENVHLDGTKSSDPEGETLTYLWKQIDGTIVSLSGSSTAQPKFIASDVGSGGESLSFELTVSNTSDLRNTDSVTVDVVPAEPVADFIGTPTSGHVALTVNFSDLSTGSITSWEWAFGDGGTSTEENPSYTYDTPGSYTVSLTVTGPAGSDTDTKPDYITASSSFYGSLTVTITPQGALDAGAQWNVDGEDWQDSGETVSGLSIGLHTVNYKDVIGWDPPSSEIVTVNDGQTAQTSGAYTKAVYSPSVATGSPSDVSFASVRLKGTVNPNDSETTVLFEYGTDTTYGLTTPETSAGSGSDYVTFSSVISGLTSDTTYHFRAKATNLGGTAYGGDKSFTTLSLASLYVEPQGMCGGKSPCFATIGEGIEYAVDGTTVYVAEGSYDEDIILDEPKEVICLGGWDAVFTTQTSYTIAKSLLIRQGTIITQSLILRPPFESISVKGP